MNQNKFFSLTFGLGTVEGQDLIPEESEQGKKHGMAAGKAVWDSNLIMEKRLSLLAQEFDKELKNIMK